MPAVSVIIPVYNTAPWLEECLTSVINQSFRDMEIICVNDASTDASSDILASFAKKDDRIRIITLEKNSGLSHARNTGMERAIGDYLYFLDSDDSIELNAIECLYTLGVDRHLDIVYFDANPIFESEELKKKFATYLFSRNRENYIEKICTGREMIEQFLEHDEWISSVPRQFYKASYLKENEIRFLDGILHEDELFSIQCAISAGRTQFVPDKLFNRRCRSNSIMTKEKSIKNFCGIFSSAFYINQIVHQKKAYSGYLRSYIARLNNRASSLYEQFGGEAYYEIAKLNDPTILDAYYLFEAFQDSYCAYGELSTGLVELIRKYEHVYIYGAGVIAKSVCRGIAKREIPVSGFVVTSCEGNPPVLEGRRVYDVNAFAATQNLNKTVVVIAVKSGKEKIRTLLEHIPVDSVDYNS